MDIWALGAAGFLAAPVFTGIKNADGIKSPDGHRNVVDPHRERRLPQERLRAGLKIFAGLTNISGPPQERCSWPHYFRWPQERPEELCLRQER
jgi:hypothetical protein